MGYSEILGQVVDTAEPEQCSEQTQKEQIEAPCNHDSGLLPLDSTDEKTENICSFTPYENHLASCAPHKVVLIESPEGSRNILLADAAYGSREHDCRNDAGYHTI